MKLFLDNNNLRQLPKEISNLTNLQQLSLRNNEVTQLPPEMGELTSLQSLHLSYYVRVPNEIKNLPNIQIFI